MLAARSLLPRFDGITVLAGDNLDSRSIHNLIRLHLE